MSKCKTCDRHWVDLSGGRCAVCLLAENAKLKAGIQAHKDSFGDPEDEVCEEDRNLWAALVKS